MTRNALALGSAVGFGLLLVAGAARAATCSAEIMVLQKQMEQTPTMAGNATSAGRGTQEERAAPNGSGEAGSTQGSDQQPLPDANGGILAQNGNATPPAEIQPMDSDAAQAGQMNTAAGTDKAAQSLVRARALDQAGDEAGCMNAVEEAKGQLGQQ